jgi:hypothetical protein
MGKMIFTYLGLSRRQAALERPTARNSRETCKQLGMSQAGRARFIGISARTGRPHVLGEAEIPDAQVLLLRALIAHGESPWCRCGHGGVTDA